MTFIFGYLPHCTVHGFVSRIRQISLLLHNNKLHGYMTFFSLFLSLNDIEIGRQFNFLGGILTFYYWELLIVIRTVQKMAIHTQFVHILSFVVIAIEATLPLLYYCQDGFTIDCFNRFPSHNVHDNCSNSKYAMITCAILSDTCSF